MTVVIVRQFNVLGGIKSQEINNESKVSYEYNVHSQLRLMGMCLVETSNFLSIIRASQIKKNETELIPLNYDELNEKEMEIFDSFFCDNAKLAYIANTYHYPSGKKWWV